MVKQWPLLGLFKPFRRRSPDHCPIVVQKSCDFRFLLNKRNAQESTVYKFDPVTFYWSISIKPGGVIYMFVRAIEFTYFYEFSIECWNCSDSVIYIFLFYSQYRNLCAWNLLLTCSSVNCITVSVEIDCPRFQSR